MPDVTLGIFTEISFTIHIISIGGQEKDMALASLLDFTKLIREKMVDILEVSSVTVVDSKSNFLVAAVAEAIRGQEQRDGQEVLLIAGTTTEELTTMLRKLS